MKIGRKIYYDLSTGNVIVDTGEKQGSVIETDKAQDILIYKELSERNIDTFDVLELSFGAFNEDFVQASSYRVNIETKELEFMYPDKNAIEQPIYEKPLTQKVKELEDAQSATNTTILELMETILGGI